MTHDQTLQTKATNAARYQHLYDLGVQKWTTTKTILFDGDYVCSRLRGSGLWHQHSYSGPGPAYRLRNFKDGSIKRIGLRRAPEAAEALCEGFRFESSGSSSHILLEQLHVQGFDAGMVFEAFDGSAIDNLCALNCHVSHCGTGVKFRGSNILAPMKAEVSTCSNCGIGFDLTQGGSGMSFDHCGGSDTEVVWLLNGGYQHEVRNAVTERAATVLRIGDFETDCGQTTPFRFHASSLRNGAKIEVYKAGKVVIDVDHVENCGLEIVCANRNTAEPLDITVPGVQATVVKNMLGKVSVNGKPVEITKV